VTGQFYWTPDVVVGNLAGGSQEQIPDDEQPRVNSKNSQPDLHKDTNSAAAGEGMELDDQAMAPASKAPRAP
jgi:hypothetical protein